VSDKNQRPGLLCYWSLRLVVGVVLASWSTAQRGEEEKDFLRMEAGWILDGWMDGCCVDA
jgi:hypothetical protein